jgi:von Willebrand factor type A domain-containing protein
MRLGRRQVVGFLVACALLVPGVLTGCGFKAGTGQSTTSGSGGMDVVGSGGQGGSKATGGQVGTGGAVVVGTGGTGDRGSGGDVGIAVDAAPPNCGQTSVSVMPVPPDILIVQDRSLSMTDDSNGKACTGGSLAGDGKCGPTSKWVQTIAAINQVVGQTQSKVNWGMIFLGDEVDQCGAATTPVVGITPGASSQLIQAALNGVQFTGATGTPTAAVMNNSVKYLQGLTDPNPKYLLLATDGEPNCAGGSLNTADGTGAENAVAAAYTAGFPTFVVGIATTTVASATTALNGMAVSGGEAQVGAATQYYAVTDTASLETVLGQIIGKAVSCTIPLSGVSGNLDKVAVSAKDASGNTIEIMQDPVNGWSYTDANKTAIILNGDACNNLKSVTYTGFQFIYTCATGIITIGEVGRR